jgi:hypothetical protein
MSIGTIQKRNQSKPIEVEESIKEEMNPPPASPEIVQPNRPIPSATVDLSIDRCYFPTLGGIFFITTKYKINPARFQ